MIATANTHWRAVGTQLGHGERATYTFDIFMPGGANVGEWMLEVTSEGPVSTRLRLRGYRSAAEAREEAATIMSLFWLRRTE